MTTSIPMPTQIPALEPPSGEVSNFQDPPSQGWATIVAIAAYLVTATPMVIARMFTRASLHKSLWWDDCQLFA